MTRAPDALRTTAGGQSDVLSRAQLLRLGVDRHMVDRRERSGAWRSIGPRVVVLHRGTLTTEQRWWVGVLHADLDADDGRHRSALTGPSAAEAGGLAGFETPIVHVAVEHGREISDLAHPLVTVDVHQTRHLEADQVHPLLQPPRLRLPRAVVESASAVAIDRPRRARALIAAAVQQRLVRPGDLRAFTVGRRTIPGRRLLLETIADAAGGAHSLPELDFLRGLRRAGLPEPTRQMTLRRANGTWYLDNDFDEFRVTVEVNGLQHYELLQSESDDLRRAVMQVIGRIVVDVSSYAVRHQIEQCMLVTAEALIAHGYQAPKATRRTLAAYRALLGWDEWTLRAS
ncbi:MAG TPA: hypothetical protein VF423_00300 [Actinomycetes bacterium]